MYVKLIKPKKDGFKAYDNTGSVSQKANYNDKEERQYLKAAEQGKLNSNDIANSYDNSSRTANYLATNDKVLKADYRGFFSDKEKQISKKDAVQYLDSANAKVPKGKERFFSYAFNFSEAESNYIEKQPNRRELIKKLTDKYMAAYARNFKYKNKNFDFKDISYIAKIHDYRKNEDGTFNNKGQLHIHVEVSRMSKDGKNELNPQTPFRDKFNKNIFAETVQKITTETTGIEPKHQVKKYQFVKVGYGSAVDHNSTLFHSQGFTVATEKVQKAFDNNRKGLKKIDPSFSKIELTFQNRFKYLLNDVSERKKIVDGFADNLAAYYKTNKIKSKNDVLYFYSYDNQKKPTLNIYIANRSVDMLSSAAINPKNFDLKKFNEQNNLILDKIVKNKEHTSPVYGQLFRLQKNTGVHIKYEDYAGKQFLKKDSPQYKHLKNINDYLQKKKGQFSEKDIEAFVYDKKELPVKKLEDIKHYKVKKGLQTQRIGYKVSGVLTQMAGLAKSQNYMLQDKYKKKDKDKKKEQQKDYDQDYNY